MKTSIFIKTCKKDLEWLTYCIRSLKFFTGEHEVVLVADDDCVDDLKSFDLSSITTHFIKKPADGYLMQELVKMQATSYTYGEYILFMDSDMIFNQPVTIESFLVDGKPMWGKGSYTNFLYHEYYPFMMGYRRFLNKITGWNCRHEYMCKPPHIILRYTLQEILKCFPNLIDSYLPLAMDEPGCLPDLPSWLAGSHAFTEFNLMGFFADVNHHDLYHWIEDPKELYKTYKTVQYWSWGGLSEDIKIQLELVLQPYGY